MRLGKISHAALASVTGPVLALIYIPPFVVLVNSFSTSRSLVWPPPDSRSNAGVQHSAALARWRHCGRACKWHQRPR